MSKSSVNFFITWRFSFCFQVVGNTTSGCYAYNVGKSVAYGYIPTFLDPIDTEVEIELVGKKYKATVVPEPLIPMEAARRRKKKN